MDVTITLKGLDETRIPRLKTAIRSSIYHLAPVVEVSIVDVKGKPKKVSLAVGED